MTEPNTTKETLTNVYPQIVNKVSQFLQGDEFKSYKKCLKSLKLITKAGIMEDIDIYDITCQNCDECKLLMNYRNEKEKIVNKQLHKKFGKLFQ
jgi:hypothetical protein